MFVTVDEKGRILIPAEILQATGIQPSDRVVVEVKGGSMIVRRASADEFLRAIRELCGITAGGPSMSNDLIADRREEDQKAVW